MHARRTASIATGIIALATFGSALPASAQANVQVQFTVGANAAGLSVTTASGTATVDNAGANPVFSPLSNGTITDTLPTVTVTDARGGLTNTWSLGVSGGSFVNQADPAVTVAASNAKVYNDFANLLGLTSTIGSGLTGGMLVTGGQFTGTTANLGTAYSMLSGTTTLGSGSVTVTPTMAVTVPAGTPAGVYQGTVTYTAT